MNQLVESRFVSVPESQAFLIIVHVKVSVKLLQGIPSRWLRWRLSCGVTCQKLWLLCRRWWYCGTICLGNKYSITSTSTSTQYNTTGSVLVYLYNVSCATQITVTTVWPTSAVHLVGSFILGHIIPKVGTTSRRGHCDNVLITVSVTPTPVPLFSGLEPMTAAGHTTEEKNIVMVVITSLCMKSTNNVTPHRVSNWWCSAIDFAVKSEVMSVRVSLGVYR